MFQVIAQRRIRGAGCIVAARVNTSGYAPRIRNEGRISFGRDILLWSHAKSIALVTFGRGEISLGDGVFVNSGACLAARTKITIGPHTKIGPDSTIVDDNYHAVHEGQTETARPIHIGRNVWLGKGVTVLPGVTIGDHSVIAAGSMVFGDVPAKQVWRGNPATYMKDVRCSDSFIRK